MIMANDSSFTAQCTEAARRFLRTVTVVDDLPKSSGVASVPPSTVQPPSAVLRPAAGAFTTDGDVPEAQHLDATVPEKGPVGLEEDRSHMLDAQTLVEAFADSKIVCSVLVSGPLGDPTARDIWKRRVRNVSSGSDMVVLDWSWGGATGEFCLELLRALREDAPDRRRLVVIYTASDDGEAISRKVQDLGASENPAKRYVFQWGVGMDIAVVQKQAAEGVEFSPFGKVAEAQLPQKVIEIFGELSGGLLANAAMHGIAAVRDSTARLLADFSRERDAAYVVHRAYSDPCSDAEEQVAALIVDSVSDVLAESDLCACVNAEAVRAWLSGRAFIQQADKDALVSGVGKGGSWRSRLASLPATLEGGSARVEEGRERHLDFAHLVYSAPVPTAARPMISTGVVVGRDDEYLICMLPLCDAARFPEKGRQVPFLHARLDGTDDAEGMGLVLRASGSTPRLHLRVGCHMYGLRSYLFKPLPPTAGQPIRATPDGHKGWIFKDAAGIEYRYVSRLRPMVAQALAADLAASGARVGLMESEYVRRESKGTRQKPRTEPTAPNVAEPIAEPPAAGQEPPDHALRTAKR